MGQRVNIQYSVEIEDLKDEVARLLAEVQDKLDGIEPLTASVTSNKEMLSLKTLDDIDQIRLQMAKADFTLADVANIIRGYINYHTQPAESSSEIETEVPLDSPAISESEIERAIENFKNQNITDEVSAER